MTDKQKQALRVLERLLDVNGEPVITKNEWLLLFDCVVGDVESITLTIPKDLKGTDTDGGVVGEKGEQGEQPTGEEMVGMGGLGKVWSEQAIISRLDKIIELLQSVILVIPRGTYIPTTIYKNPLDPDPNELGGWEITANIFGSDNDINTNKIKQNETSKPES